MKDASDNLADSSDALERPLIEAAWAQFEALARQHEPSSTDGRGSFAVPGYRILREIYRGGQGVIYQAMQASTQRKVAIKILKEGPLADHTELARFDREVDVLSRLNHPHIVAIHDRGLAAGHAYFVMDYIPGRPLDAYVTGEALSTREVLELCRKVCEAVNVAHLRGVIHRDLKPGNIRIDEEGEPHVLDFGLAKFVRETSSSADAMTMTGHFVGSLPWASPEQAEGRSDLLDIRTDVYSLGVILYHLLAGCFPYPVTGRMDDVVRNIMHTSPTRPSTLGHDIDRDVEIILLKSLAKDPERRYQSAGELARDIQRYLNGEVIEARPASSFYQLRQFARRNKALVGSAIAVIVILAAATTGTTWAMLLSREASAQAVAINDFMREVLTSPAPKNQGADVRLIDVLAKASTSAGQRFAEHPLEEAQVRDTLGQIYDHLTRWPEAKAEYQKALALWQEQVGADDPRALSSELMFAVMALQIQQAYEAEPVLAGLVPRLERVFGPDDPKTLDARRAIATAHLQRGRMDEAERILLELRAHPRLVDDDGAQIEILQGLVSVNRHRANIEDLVQRRDILDQGEPLARECVNRLLRSEGPDSSATLHAQASLAIVLWQQGKYSDAADTCRAILDRSLNSLGECHFVRLQAMGTLALALNGLGEEAEPAELYLRKIECMRQHNPAGSPQLLSDLFDALRFLDRAGRAEEGEALARELTAALRQLGGVHGDIVFDSELYIARFISMQDRFDESESVFRSLLSREKQAGQADRARLHLFYGSYLARRGQFEEAERQLLTAVDLVGNIRTGTWDSHPDDIIIEFVALHEAWGKPDKVEEYRQLRREVRQPATPPGSTGGDGLGAG